LNGDGTVRLSLPDPLVDSDLLVNSNLLANPERCDTRSATSPTVATTTDAYPLDVVWALFTDHELERRRVWPLAVHAAVRVLGAHLVTPDVVAIATQAAAGDPTDTGWSTHLGTCTRALREYWRQIRDQRPHPVVYAELGVLEDALGGQVVTLFGRLYGPARTALLHAELTAVYGTDSGNYDTVLDMVRNRVPVVRLAIALTLLTRPQPAWLQNLITEAWQAPAGTYEALDQLGSAVLTSAQTEIVHRLVADCLGRGDQPDIEQIIRLADML
jgi:hypothetical protein